MTSCIAQIIVFLTNLAICEMINLWLKQPNLWRKKKKKRKIYLILVDEGDLCYSVYVFPCIGLLGKMQILEPLCFQLSVFWF